MSIACRSELEQTLKELGSSVLGFSVDLASVPSILAFCKKVKESVDRDGAFDLLCLNAGMTVWYLLCFIALHMNSGFYLGPPKHRYLS